MPHLFDAITLRGLTLPHRIFVSPMCEYSSRDGFANVISEVGKQLPKAATLKFEDVVDLSIMEKLDKTGFIDSLYK